MNSATKELDEFPEDRWHANSFGDRVRVPVEGRVHSLKERMTSEEQVGQEDGRIPLEFQRLVPAGETAFPACNREHWRKHRGDEGRKGGRILFKDFEGASILKTKLF